MTHGLGMVFTGMSSLQIYSREESINHLLIDSQKRLQFKTLFHSSSKRANIVFLPTCNQVQMKTMISWLLYTSTTHFYVLTLKTKPVRPTRAMVKAAAPRSILVAAQTCAPRYVPPSVWISAPATGLPVKLAKATTLKTIPILVPSLLRSSVSAARETANRDWMAEANKP